MKISYYLMIKDLLEGYEMVYFEYDSVLEGVLAHKEITTDKRVILKIIKSDFVEYTGEIDEYYLENPYKRFEATLEVGYED